MMLLSAPLSWLSARNVSALPQPQPADLAALPAGTRALITAQLPLNMPTDGSGLALFYVERQVPSTTSTSNPQATTVATEWQTVIPPPARLGMVLADGRALFVQIGPATRFLNAQQVAINGQNSVNSQQRAIGYQAGQVLTMQGTWEGNHLFTAVELYAGSPTDYLVYLRHIPGLGLAFGFICGGSGLFLLIVGAVLRFVGK